MRIPSQIAENVVLREGADTVEISMHATRRPMQALILAAWLAGWGYAWLEVAREIDMRNWPDEIMPLVWLVLWSLAGVAVAYRLLESLFGRETVIVEPSVVRLGYKSLGIGRSRSFPLAELSDLRVATSADRKGRRRGAGRGLLAFDHRGQVVLCGRSLNRAVAQKIVEKVTARFPSLGPEHG